MKERPIIFSGEMVRAILDGRKTQTRRPVKPQPEMELEGEMLPDGTGGCGWEPVLPPYNEWPYQIGERLWVRETFKAALLGSTPFIDYRATVENDDPCTYPITDEQYLAVEGKGVGWRPSIHMPRWASRITLEITGVRVERLQDISEEDAKAEGVERSSARSSFLSLWDSIYGKAFPRYKGKDRSQLQGTLQHSGAPYSWDANPWVWVIEFKRVEREEV